MVARVVPRVLLAGAILCGSSAAAFAQNNSQKISQDISQNKAAQGANSAGGPPPNPVSPVRRINRDNNPLAGFPGQGIETQSMDGADNNSANQAMNAAHGMLYRWLPSAYSDGVSALAGANRPGPREISNAVSAQAALLANEQRLTDYFWQWGQFLDHDIDLTDGTDPAELANVSIPAGDAWFDPAETGDVELMFNRSIYHHATGLGTAQPREQLNEITGWIDASNVYGSDDVRAMALRTLDGTGRLRVSAGRLLPFNRAGLPNAGDGDETFFLAGDVRANEQLGLIAMHTLFVREHNRQAHRLHVMYPELSGDQIYNQVRARVAGLMQAITYREFLPLLLGPNPLPRYRGYDPAIDARIMNSFSTAAFRLGHSLLSPRLMRVDARGREHAAGHLPLRDAFFAPQEIIEHGVEPVLRGLAAQICQRLDIYVIDDVRNFLFGAPGRGGFDLAALNIQRGRDHGLPGYNDARAAAGLPRAQQFSDISPDDEVLQRLRSIYTQVDDVDLWVGGLAEAHVRGSQVGPLFHRILSKQFLALRDGDRFWYENRFDRRTVAELNRTRLADVIRRNTRIGRELRRDVFRLPRGAAAQDQAGPPGKRPQ